ncbi:aldo/keto reductase [Leucobacter sp. HY1910]
MPSDLAGSLPRLGYGAANLGNLFRALTDDEAWQVLEAAWNSGVRYFDTAPHYGLGLSERRLGEFLRTKPRHEYVVSTKVGRLLRDNPAAKPGELDLANDFHVPATLQREWDASEAGIRASVEESLARTGLDRFDVLFLHDPERYNLDSSVDTALPALEQLRAEGVARGVGVGSMTTSALTRCVREAQLDVIMIAGRYTLLEQPAAAELLPACRDRSTRVVAASVFNSGLLASDTPKRDARYEYGAVPAEVWQRLARISQICAAHGVSVPVAAAQFALRHPSVASVVLGGSRPAQLVQNAERMAVDVPHALWCELEDAGLIDRIDGIDRIDQTGRSNQAEGVS